MSKVGAVVDAVFGSYDLKNAKQWRDEDIKHREQEKQWREDAILRELAWRNADLEREKRLLKLEHEKRLIDARQSQLTALSQLSALLGGFIMVVIVEINFPPHLSQVLLFLYGTVGALEFIFMLMCMLSCTLMLIALTRYVTHTLEGEVRSLSVVELDLVSPFYTWWLKKCEDEWLMAYRFFRWGVSFFLVEIALLGWVQFVNSVVTSIIITVLCIGGILFWQLRVASKWRYLVRFPDGPN